MVKVSTVEETYPSKLFGGVNLFISLGRMLKVWVRVSGLLLWQLNSAEGGV